jgi:ribonuclease P protein component
VGKAVVRNRIKRVLREAFRIKRPFDSQAVDIVVIPRKSLPKESPFALVSDDFDEFVRRAEPIVQRFEGTP